MARNAPRCTAALPEYRWEQVDGFSPEEVATLQTLIESLAHIIFELARVEALSMPQLFKVRSASIIEKWVDTFHEISYYC